MIPINKFHSNKLQPNVILTFCFKIFSENYTPDNFVSVNITMKTSINKKFKNNYVCNLR